ncbi:neuropeptide FF receptor 2 [Pocillopora verrucosa]|uniref:neuropeptide FF receptor 2 n=1 Tax=Pocillopora verrucosa TaxID=203993 RepID=UPI003342DDFF
MAHIENHHHDSPEMSLKCSFLSSMNLYLLLVGAFGFFLNIFPCVVCYAKLRTRCGRTSRDVLLMSLILVDFLTVCIPVPIYLLLYNNCPRSQRSNHVERPAICEIFHLMFMWFKLASLFIITTLNYTSYLAMTARGIYRSIGDRISSSLACSRHEQKHRENLRNSSLVIANLVVGIAIVALLIASLPYIGLGPEGKTLTTQSHSSKTLPKENLTILFCSLEQISYPRQNSDYTFLFALLMSSSACLLLQIVHNVLGCFNCSGYSLGGTSAIRTSKSFVLYSRRLGAERDFAKMICVLGLTFHVTWIPVMVAVGCIMSGHQISAEFSQYVIAVSFLSPSLNPVFFAVFLQEFRDGYMAVFQFIRDKIFSLCKDCLKLRSKPTEVITTSVTSSGISAGKGEQV